MSPVRLPAIGTALALACIVLIPACDLSPDLSGSLEGHVLVQGTSQIIGHAVVQCYGMSTHSDDSGRYALDGIPSGHEIVAASAPGYDDYAMLVSIQGPTVYDIEMSPTVLRAHLFGTVGHDIDGPVEGALVELGGFEVLTDSTGFYEYDDVPYATYQLNVTKSGYRDYSGPVHVNADECQCDVSIKKLASVTVYTDADTDMYEQLIEMNYGAETGLDLHYDESFHWKFVVSFPLDLPESAEPMTATLRLYNIWMDGDADPRTILVARLLEPWDEMEVAWIDTLDSTGGATAEATYTPRWYEIDVREYVADWTVGGCENYGLEIDTLCDPDARRFSFASREYEEEDKRAHVVVEYAW